MAAGVGPADKGNAPVTLCESTNAYRRVFQGMPLVNRDVALLAEKIVHAFAHDSEHGKDHECAAPDVEPRQPCVIIVHCMLIRLRHTQTLILAV